MPTKSVLVTFADRLTALREAAGVTTYRLAQLSGINRQQLGRLEKGQRRPSWEAVCRLADALSVSTEAFRTTAVVGNNREPSSR